MHRIALIGCGWHSENHHAPALARIQEDLRGQVEVTVCDIDRARAEAARARHGFAAVATRQEDLLEQDYAAAIVVLPVPLLLESARAWTSRGVPLLLEKPLGGNLDQAREIAQIAEESRRGITVSLNRRFDPALGLALDWIRAQPPIRFIGGRMYRVERGDPDFLWSTAIHLLDAMCFAAGPLTLSSPPDKSMELIPGCGCIADLAGNGLVGTAEIIPVSGRIEESIRMTGAGWCVDVWTGTSHPWKVQAFRNGQLELDSRAARTEAEFLRNGTYAETKAFVSAVLAGQPVPRPWPTDALVASQLAAKLQELHASAAGEPRL